MITAEHKSEERYAKLSIVFDTKEEEEKVCSVVDDIVSKNSIKPGIYTCELPNNKKVLVVEYHDDYDRSSESIFNNMMKNLGISHC
ncbi:hypothetical protein [Sulfurimonas sp. HSL-1716]|uniref:hypothetical protein n=1 Tax=Hydrocurvibacter sulfurireducens TaxID=3131937 RepID=UPI0031F7EB56